MPFFTEPYDRPTNHLGSPHSPLGVRKAKGPPAIVRAGGAGRCDRRGPASQSEAKYCDLGADLEATMGE